MILVWFDVGRNPHLRLQLLQIRTSRKGRVWAGYGVEGYDRPCGEVSGFGTGYWGSVSAAFRRGVVTPITGKRHAYEFVVVILFYFYGNA